MLLFCDYSHFIDLGVANSKIGLKVAVIAFYCGFK